MKHNYQMSKRRKKGIPKLSKGEIYISLNHCDGCGKCVIICPNNVLVLKEISDNDFQKLSVWGKLKVKKKGRQKSHITNIEACVLCYKCEKVCHESAIFIQK